MKNVITRGTLFFSVISALVLGVASPAAASVIDDAVTALESGTSYYVAPGIGGNVPANFDGANIAVVVTEINGNSTLNPSQFAEQISGRLGDQYDTVIVVNTDATSNFYYGVVPGASSEAILPILNGGSGVDWLNTHEAEITTAIGQTVTSTETDVAPVASLDAFSVLGFGGALIGAVLLTSVIFVLIKKSKNRVRAITTRVIKRDEMKEAMETLGRLTSKHNGLHYKDTTKLMTSILSRLNELFSRLERKGIENQKNLAEVEYANIIQKLNNALGEDYYLDIAGNDNLWDRGDERLYEVEEAARAVDEQILHNIRQVNSSRDLDFRVALEGIMRSVNQPNAADMLRKPEERRGR